MKKYLKFLRTTYGNSVEDIVPVKEETETAYYYYDSFRRWCYLDKIEDKDTFRVLSKPYGKDKPAQYLAEKITEGLLQNGIDLRKEPKAVKTAARWLLDNHVELSDRS